MSKSIKECVRGLSKNRDVDTLLPDYVKQSIRLNDDYARLKLMMEYYMYYETVSEGINPYIDSAKDTTEALNQIIEIFFEKNPGREECKVLTDRLLELRREVICKMHVLTAYVDCFVVYEYILNRIQYRFEDMELLPDDAVFAQDVVNFIFGTKDNVAVNDNIHFVIGQLPMRMSRSRYFDIIRESVSVYKGSDVSSLEAFAYMFRTNAMLYKDDNMDKYFTEFKPVLDELIGLDYENMDEKLYNIYAEKIRINASKLNDISDLYMQLGGLINSLYIIVSAEAYNDETIGESAEDIVVRGVNALFMERDSDVWKIAGDAVLVSDEDKISWLGGYFADIEGRQEKIWDALNMAGAVLDETIEVQEKAIKELGFEEAFVLLKQMSQLTSNSIFAELETVTDDRKVTSDMADEMAGKLIDEVKELFKGSSRMLRRAVMANTLEKMPVFFKNPQEVADYITSSLGQCDDTAEKYASKQLIIDVMQ